MGLIIIIRKFTIGDCPLYQKLYLRIIVYENAKKKKRGNDQIIAWEYLLHLF